MLQQMKRIQVIGPKKEFGAVIDLLYHEGTIHLEDACQCIQKEEISLIPMEREKTAEVTEIQGRITGILSTLPEAPADPTLEEQIASELQDKTRDDLITRAHETIRELELVTRELASRKSDLKLKITTWDRYAKILNFIQPMERELPVLENYEVTILLIKKEFSEVLDLVRKEITTITHDQFEMNSMSVDAETLATIMVFNKRYSQAVHSFVFSVNVNEVRLPQEYMGKPFYAMFAQIESDKARAAEEIRLIDEKLVALSHRWFHELTYLKKMFEDISEELLSFNKFGHSEYMFVVMGWIPKKFLRRMKEAVKKTFGDRVIVSELGAGAKEMEKAPTFYDNPRWIKPFETIMQLVSPPAYREVDPSPVLAIFFPFFFGLMVGDIGYGLVILAFALIVKKKLGANAFAKSISEILIISSIPTIIFGFLYGEFFGDFGEMMGWIQPVHLLGITWNRVDAMIPMLVFAIAVGVIHVFLGLAIGIRNEMIRKNKKHVAVKVGMLLVITAIILLLTLYLVMIPSWMMYPTAVMAIVAILLIIYGGGALGPMEIMSSVGNILSYARLMAIGMASVILAIVANRIGGAIEIAIIGVIAAVLLHTLNIILAMFSPSIHSMRLHLVEFFSKFYEGGGIMYKPFKRVIP
ncbi:V-type ATP synthase subunit I [Methanoregula sp.]|uniref:V-type ATP synthase subunit I n=1 Tax=Methanoregula sp. TaxID=2052170 RepID=UPI0035665BAF